MKAPRNTQGSSKWLGLLALLWLVIVIAVYYAAHKPFTPNFAISAARAAGQLAVALAILSLAGGLGTRLLPDIHTHSLAAFALRGAFGAGLLSIAVFVISSTAGTVPWLGWAGLVIPLLLLHRSVRGWWEGVSGLRYLLQSGGRFGKSIAVLCCLIFAAALLIALAPPLKFDALVYHLTLPKQYLETGRIEYLSGNIFWGMPQLGEMLYLWAMTLGGVQAAASLGWGVAALAVVGLLGYTGAQIGPAAAWVAAASLLAGYTIASEPGWAYVDCFTILYGLAFLAALHGWWKSGRTAQLALAGVFGGFAFGSKYSGGALIAAGAVVVLYNRLRWSTLRAAMISLGVFSLAAVASAAPWLVKNLLATGNPLYPFLYPSGAMDAYRLELYQGFPVWGGWKDVLLLPWQAAVTGHEGAPGYAASIGPLVLALAPVYVAGLLLIPDPKLRKLQLSAGLGLCGLLIWAVAGRLSGYLIQTRLYLAFFPALAALAAGGYRVIARIHLPGVRLGRLAGSLILLVLGLTALQVVLDVSSKGAARAVAGLITPDEYLDANLGWYAPAMRSIHDMPPQSRVLMLWEPRSLYCTPQCVPDEVLDRWSRDLHAFGEPLQVLAGWRQEGFSHLLLHNAGADFIRQEDNRFSEAEWKALDELLGVLVREEDFGQAYTLYRLNP